MRKINQRLHICISTQSLRDKNEATEKQFQAGTSSISIESGLLPRADRNVSVPTRNLAKQLGWGWGRGERATFSLKKGVGGNFNLRKHRFLGQHGVR